MADCAPLTPSCTPATVGAWNSVHRMAEEAPVSLRFIAKDPNTDGANCPTVWVDHKKEDRAAGLEGGRRCAGGVPADRSHP